jgi:hypothetical protein
LFDDPADLIGNATVIEPGIKKCAVDAPSELVAGR